MYKWILTDRILLRLPITCSYHFLNFLSYLTDNSNESIRPLFIQPIQKLERVRLKDENDDIVKIALRRKREQVGKKKGSVRQIFFLSFYIVQQLRQK